MQDQEIQRLTTPAELNNRASFLITSLHQYTFSNLPAILNRIITEKAWGKLPTPFKNFGEYALNQGVDGLGIDSNEKLWLLRCALDFEGKHIVEWKDVLVGLEGMAKVRGILPLNKSAVSLSKLAKMPEIGNKITYTPSKAKNTDNKILQLSQKDSSSLTSIANGDINKTQAYDTLGIKDIKKDFSRAKSAINKLDEKSRREIIEWMTESGYITT